MGIHDGHRERMRNRFLEHGLDNFDDHNVLELLLFYTSARGDTNPVAHELMREFRSLSNVFDAPMEELVKIRGIGENTAALIKLIPQIARRYLISRGQMTNILDSTQKAGDYMVPYFFGQQDESVCVVCLDAKRKVLSCRVLFHGTVNAAEINIRKLVEYALHYRTTSVIIAHNHTSGIALPSTDDEITTREVERALRTVDIELLDHIIVSEGDYVSLADDGFFR